MSVADIAILVGALTGAGTGIGALVLNRKAQADTAKASDVAGKISETGTALQWQSSLISQLQEEVRAGRQRVIEVEDRHDKEVARLRANLTACERNVRHLRDELVSAVAVIRDEVAKEAAKLVLDQHVDSIRQSLEDPDGAD